MTVWVVLRGEWDDRRIVAVFDDEDTAYEYAGAFGWVERFDVLSANSAAKFIWRAYVNANNLVVVEEPQISDDIPAANVWRAQELYRKDKWIGEAWGNTEELAKGNLSNAIRIAEENSAPAPTYEENLEVMRALSASRISKGKA